MLPPPVQPLPPDVWDNFVAALERGPSPKHVEAVKRAMDLTCNMSRPGHPDYDEPETQRAIAETRRNAQPIVGLKRVEPRPPGSRFPSRRTIARQGGTENAGAVHAASRIPPLGAMSAGIAAE